MDIASFLTSKDLWPHQNIRYLDNSSSCRPSVLNLWSKSSMHLLISFKIKSLVTFGPYFISCLIVYATDPIINRFKYKFMLTKT